YPIQQAFYRRLRKSFEVFLVPWFIPFPQAKFKRITYDLKLCNSLAGTICTTLLWESISWAGRKKDCGGRKGLFRSSQALRNNQRGIPRPLALIWYRVSNTEAEGSADIAPAPCGNNLPPLPESFSPAPGPQ